MNLEKGEIMLVKGVPSIEESTFLLGCEVVKITLYLS